jgi:hypothetical protein
LVLEDATVEERQQRNAPGPCCAFWQLGMNAETLPYFEMMAPLTFVFGAIVLLSPTLPLSRPWARSLIFGVVWGVIARYLDWRLFETVLPR